MSHVTGFMLYVAGKELVEPTKSRFMGMPFLVADSQISRLLVARGLVPRDDGEYIIRNYKYMYYIYVKNISIMSKSVNYTSSLPSELLAQVEEYAEKFKVPKNKIIEKSLLAYFENLKKAEYIRSFRKAANEAEIASMAEEGLEDYLKILDEL